MKNSSAATERECGGASGQVSNSPQPVIGSPRGAAILLPERAGNYPRPAAMTDRIADGLRYLSAQFSIDADEFRRDNAPGGDMLLAGLVSRGYVHERGGWYAVSDAGRRRLTAVELADGE